MTDKEKPIISYTILACSEHDELNNLLRYLIKHKLVNDEIHVTLDQKNTTEKVYGVLSQIKAENLQNDIKLFIWSNELNKNFSAQKNYCHGMCHGDFIFNIDADEIPNSTLLSNIHSIISANPAVELYYVPRINTVDGITQEHIDKWKWSVNELGHINFPDYQGRIYRRNENIRWEKPVHERITGNKTQAFLPAIEEYCIYHHKNILKQEYQNKFYENI